MSSIHARQPVAEVEVFVNGESWTLPGSSTITTLIGLLGVTPSGIAVAVQGEVLPRSQWSELQLHGEERIEIITAAAGG